MEGVVWLDKQKLIDIFMLFLGVSIIVFIGFVVGENMVQATEELQTICKNMTPEKYDITPNHEACVFNETTKKYDLVLRIEDTVT
jgi:hypothetical protein